MIYQKNNLELGKLSFCCDAKFTNEIKRISKLLEARKKTPAEIYVASYNSIRGRVANIIFQAALGANERKYVRESEVIKNGSILKNVSYWLESCSAADWDQAIRNFQKRKTKKNIAKIICLYSPLYRDDQGVVEKMSNEIASYFNNFPEEWKQEEMRVISNHLGISNTMIGDRMVEFKFAAKKLTINRSSFERLYRHYRSACRINPRERNFIKRFCIFSPITGQQETVDVEEAITVWKLEENFQASFSIWRLNSLISVSKTGENVVKGILEFEEKQKIS